MAKAFPRSRFVGHDVYSPNIAKAKKLAEQAGVADRVSFVELDASGGFRFESMKHFYMADARRFAGFMTLGSAAPA
jgi:tRNA G46 methylase TrmB